MLDDTKKDAVEDKHEKSVFENHKYIELIYSEKRRPRTDYPAKLAAYLRDEGYGGTGTLLDIGCGRGDLLKALFDAGFSVAGVDLSPISAELCEPHQVRIANLEKDELPYPSASYKYVFSKSVIEHLQTPIPFLKESYRVLTPGGR